MQSKKKWFVVFILLAALAGAAFYFLYFIRTPAYALNEARVALQQHDSAKFSRYVDVPSVMDNAFEDIIKAESKINNDNVFFRTRHSAYAEAFGRRPDDAGGSGQNCR